MRILILIIVTSMFLTSCTSGYSGNRRSHSSVDSNGIIIESKDYNMLQVVHSNGMVENIEDKINLRPIIGDTIVIHDLSVINRDSSSYYDRYVWGKYTKLMPEDIISDSLIATYKIVRVLKITYN